MKQKMKYISCLLLLFSITTGMSAQSTSEWVNLFNGKDFKGWKKLNGDAQYKIIDGAIIGYCKMNTPNTFLVTENEYDNFILEFDFKIDDGLNSGVQIRSQSLPNRDNGRVHGYQFEIDPKERAWTGGIYDEARRGWLYPLSINQSARKAYHNREWNKARIEAIGNSIRTWVNGIACAELWDDMTPKGFIALQVHNIENKKDEGKIIGWKNIKICTVNPEKYKTPNQYDIPEVNSINNSLSEREMQEGWSLLWDGKTTNGWKGVKLNSFPEKGWKMDKGVLKVQKSEGKESANGGDIITSQKYKNFKLKVDFKITDGANSGIKYFVDPDLNKGEGSAIGCEYQILDDKKHPDAKLGVNGNRTLGSVYDLIPAPQNKPFDKGSFNTALIVVNGNHIEHWLNGIKIVEYDRNNQTWNALVAYSKYKDWPNFGNAESGHILLQDHGDEVSFRNMKIKELK